MSPPSLRPVAAVLAVVVRGGEILLVRRANPPDAGLWGFPGGRIEPGEGLLRAAARELLEETGVIAQPVDAFAAVDAIGPASGTVPGHHYVLIAVQCDWLSGEPVAADDALEARWFTMERLTAADTVKSFAVDTVAAKAMRLARRDPATEGSER